MASLFSIEFYDLIMRYLNDDGVLVQWLQLYEFDDYLLASVINAITARFPNYVVYQTDDSDLVVVASRGAKLDALAPTICDAPALKNELARVGIHHIDDLRAHRIGSRATLEPLFASFNAPINSDYRPYVDQHAPKARFMETLPRPWSGSPPRLCHYSKCWTRHGAYRLPRSQRSPK